MDISTVENSIKTYIKLSGKEKRKQVKEIFGERAKEFSISMSDGIPILSHKEYRLQFVYVSFDPIYQFSKREIEKRIEEVRITVMQQMIKKL